MLRLIGTYWKDFSSKALIGLLAKGVEVVFELLTPFLVAKMIDEGLGNNNQTILFTYVFLLLIFAVVGYCSTLLTQKLAADVSQGIGTRIRDDVFSHVMSLSTKELDLIGAGSVITRITSDINQVQLAVAMFIRTFVRWPFLSLGSMIAAIMIDAQMGRIFLVTVPTITLIFALIMSKTTPYFQKAQELLDAISTKAREVLSGMRVIYAFGREHDEEKKLRALAQEHARISLLAGIESALLNPLTVLIMNVSIVVILMKSGVRVESHDLSQGQVVAFINYVTLMLLSIAFLANIIIIFTKGFASAERVLEILDTKSTLNFSTKDDVPITSAAPVIHCQDLSFSFSSEAQPVLSGISFELHQGQTLGIIGGTGSGKSTLANLLSRIYDRSSGTLLLFGHDIIEFSEDQLYSLVSLVPQHPSLLTGTIRSNINWRKADASDEELIQAMKIAQAEDILTVKEKGLDEGVHSGGTNVSGGQRARICIARALVGNPSLLILDDAASALDFATDARLRRALQELEMTKVIISQRVSAVRHAHIILVLDHGKMVGLGTHEQLIKTCSLYSEICTSQHVQEVFS